MTGMGRAEGLVEGAAWDCATSKSAMASPPSKRQFKGTGFVFMVVLKIIFRLPPKLEKRVCGVNGVITARVRLNCQAAEEIDFPALSSDRSGMVIENPPA
jgi:hypothetical protein